MASYRIEWKRSASRELKRLQKSTLRRVLDVVEGLALNLYPHGVVKLAGSQHTYRLRVGDYRILYTTESDILVIEVLRVGHRRDVYR